MLPWPRWPRRPSPSCPGEDWIQLFNGRDLTGWVEVGSEKWTVEDGVIHGQGVSKEYGYLRTEKRYKDFHMSLWFKCLGAGNSGLFFHTEFKPGTPAVTQSLQSDIDKRVGPYAAEVF